MRTKEVEYVPIFNHTISINIFKVVSTEMIHIVNIFILNGLSNLLYIYRHDREF